MMALTAAEAHALTTSRAEAWRYDLLDLADHKIGELDGVTSGNFDFTGTTAIRSGGSMTCVAQGIDWLQVRIQPWYTATAEGQTITWPIGVFIPASPSVSYATPGGVRDLELYDKLLILDQDHIGETFSVAEGTNVTTAIRGILTGIGEVRDAITDSTETLNSAMVWEADTSKLQIINDLLKAIDYLPLSADGRGIFQAAPYREPGLRGIAWNFADDRDSIYGPAFSVEEDNFHVPNIVTLISTSDGETASMTSEARNEDPDSKYSFNQRQRWISKVETEVEATSQGVLDGLAQRRLIDLSSVTATYTIEHAFIPLDLDDAVRFTRTAEGITTAAVVQSMSISTEVGALVKTTLTGVVL